MIRKTCISLLIVLCACSNAAYADGIGTLIQVSKNMGEVEKACQAETAAHGRVKQAVANGSLTTGVSREAVYASYGEPVVMNIHTASGREKWIYMPSDSNHFTGEKICLYFREEVLHEIEVRE